MFTCEGDSITTIRIEYGEFRPHSLARRMDFDGEGVSINLPNSTAITLRDKLNGLFPPEPDEPELGLPEEPKEPGFYITQQNLLLNKNPITGWNMTDSTRWKDGGYYTNDWGVVYEALGDEAFPLTKLNTRKED